MIASPGARPQRRSAVELGLAGLFVYMVLIGGTGLAEGGVGPIRLITGLISGGLIVTALVWLRHESFDRIDRFVIGALVPFSIAAVVSSFPRQSFDALLAAVGFAAALLVARRALRERSARQLFIACLVSLSAVLTIATFVRWVLPAIEWWAGTGWQVVPPLNFELAGSPWGHRHDLTLLLVLAYPAWWVGHASRLRRVAALVVGALLIPIVLVDGSRAVWVALAGASVIAGGPWVVRRLQSSRPARSWLIAAVALVTAALVVTGLGAALLQRGLSPTSFGWRLSMWGPLLDQWTSQPIAGSGPGAFPWVLQLTDYFDTNSWAPRHPDSAIFQVIPEAGLLGLVAVALLVMALAPAAWRSHSAAGRWALVAFSIACLGANPTDFAFLVVLTIGWAAYVSPREARAPEPARPLNRFVRTSSLAALALIGVGYALMTVGSFAYDRAREAVGSGDVSSAASALAMAGAFDPGLALYSRERGAALYLAGDVSGAIAELEHAAVLNRVDDLTWRSLGLAYLAAGRGEDASAAVGRAVDLQRSDPTNLLTMAAIEVAKGNDEAARASLAEIVQAWPATVFSVAWADALPPAATTAEIVETAVARWRTGQQAPELSSDQGLWLTALAGDGSEPDALSESVHSPALSQALIAAVECKDVGGLLDEMGSGEERSYLYWWLRARAAILDGSEDPVAVRMTEIMGQPLQPGQIDEVLIPTNERGFDRYGWGYRRAPIDWPSAGVNLPSPNGGLMRWTLGPAEAACEARR